MRIGDELDNTFIPKVAVFKKCFLIYLDDSVQHRAPSLRVISRFNFKMPTFGKPVRNVRQSRQLVRSDRHPDPRKREEGLPRVIRVTRHGRKTVKGRRDQQHNCRHPTLTLEHWICALVAIYTLPTG